MALWRKPLTSITGGVTPATDAAQRAWSRRDGYLVPGEVTG
ncbi:hypothetical protein OG589_39305 [Sphaerisporangium sp. NBC_01403]